MTYADEVLGVTNYIMRMNDIFIDKQLRLDEKSKYS
jgi:hypothetical protein